MLKFQSILATSLLASLFFFTWAQADSSDDLALEKRLSAEYLEKMAAEPNAKVTEQGVILRSLFETHCTPENPCRFAQATDTIKVAYHLVDRTGKTIDEIITSDELAVFPLNKLIKCWQIAIPQISIGSFYKVSCPSEVAYGDKGASDIIKPGAALTFRLTVYDLE